VTEWQKGGLVIEYWVMFLVRQRTSLERLAVCTQTMFIF